MKPLRAQDVAALLSLYEYRCLCQFFDLRGSPKFDVFGVERGEQLLILCKGEDDVLLNLDATPYRTDRVRVLPFPAPPSAQETRNFIGGVLGL